MTVSPAPILQCQRLVLSVFYFIRLMHGMFLINFFMHFNLFIIIIFIFLICIYVLFD